MFIPIHSFVFLFQCLYLFILLCFCFSVYTYSFFCVFVSVFIPIHSFVFLFRCSPVSECCNWTIHPSCVPNIHDWRNIEKNHQQQKQWYSILLYYFFSSKLNPYLTCTRAQSEKAPNNRNDSLHSPYISSRQMGTHIILCILDICCW